MERTPDDQNRTRMMLFNSPYSKKENISLNTRANFSGGANFDERGPSGKEGEEVEEEESRPRC